MRKTVTIVLCSLFVLCASKTIAQSGKQPYYFNFGVEGGVPTGVTSNAYSVSLGGTFRFGLHAGPGSVTFTTGAIGYFPKTTDNDAKAGIEVPFRVGYKYLVVPHFFIMGELGYADFISYYDDAEGNRFSASSGSFIGGISAGFQIHNFEIGPRYGVIFNNGGGGDLALRVGWNF
jgi:hypothetical protein